MSSRRAQICTLCDTIHTIVLSGVKLSDTMPMNRRAKIRDLISDVHDLHPGQALFVRGLLTILYLRSGLPSTPADVDQGRYG